MFNFSPAPQIPNDVQAELKRACSSQKISPLHPTRQLQGVIKSFEASRPNHPDRERFVEVAGLLFARLIQAGHAQLLPRFNFDKGVAKKKPLLRFEIAAKLSTLLHTPSLREQRSKEISRLCESFREHLTHDAQCACKALTSAPVAHRAQVIRSFIEKLEQRGPRLEETTKDLVSQGLAADSPGLSAEAQRALLTRFIAFHEQQEESLRRDVVISLINSLIEGSIKPLPQALTEVSAFCRDAGGHFLALVKTERENDRLVRGPRQDIDEATAVNLLGEISSATLWLMIERNMPADVAKSVAESLALVGLNRRLERIGDFLGQFARNSTTFISPSEDRIAEPLGRAALLGSLKVFDEDQLSGGIGSPERLLTLLVEIPSSEHLWRYFGRRLAYLSKIKDPEVREDRLFRYVTSFREFLTAGPFYREEERYFRELHLDGRSSAEARKFYKEVYGVDNGPGLPGHRSAEEPLAETAKAFRLMATARHGLNVRKGYARSFARGPWMLEEIATELKGTSQRFKVADRELYPGPGVRLAGLLVKNALDFSTPESRRYYLKGAPWLGAAMRAGADVEYHFFRGFIAITRSLNAATRPLGGIWRDVGSFDGEPYAAIIFNDHFYNDLLPEVRMWLVPEKVLHRKLAFAIENRVDVNLLDITPEGLAEEAAALGLTIFDTGNSCVRWGSFANAWPFGEGPAHYWEKGSDWAKSPWQSPRHVHRALSREDYQETITSPVALTMARARVEHDIIKKTVQFFLDLHSSFLTMEEGWAKGYANADEDPAVIVSPAKEEERGDSDRQPESAQDENPFEGLGSLEPTRPRTRIFERFLAMRNEIARSGAFKSTHDFPILELQYTRLFARQAETAYITGAGLVLHLPNGTREPLVFRDRPQRGVLREEIELDEHLEAAWDHHFVSKFALGNCPRIILP